MKASLQLNLSQQLTLTPQLQQAIRLLQLSTLDLNQEIQQAIESNPMLEMISPVQPAANQKISTNETTTKEVVADLQWGEHYSSTPIKKSNNDDNYNYEHFCGTSLSLQEHLLWQLNVTPISDIDHIIALAIIDAIDDDGFLTLSAEEITHSLSDAEHPIDLDEVNAVLHRIQRFDPIGCGAADLGECLAIQLKQLPENTPLLSQTIAIVSQDIDLLGQHNYKQLMKNHRITEDELGKIIEFIKTLQPRPGSLIESSKRTEYIMPDVLVKKKKNQWVVELNADTLPRLKINHGYASLIQRANNSADNVYLKNNLQEARWFMKSLQSRQDTLLKVATAIIDYQKDFLEHGDEAMKPLVLNDIAQSLDMHESTISRVTTQKYLHTPRGIFELKYFFSSHVNTNTGGECSSTAIRAVIKKLIAAENPKKPLSDNKIAQLIREQGIQVARRTIAKYRETMSIPPSNERKSIVC